MQDEEYQDTQHDEEQEEFIRRISRMQTTR